MTTEIKITVPDKAEYTVLVSSTNERLGNNTVRLKAGDSFVTHIWQGRSLLVEEINHE